MMGKYNLCGCNKKQPFGIALNVYLKIEKLFEKNYCKMFMEDASLTNVSNLGTNA